MRNRRHALLPVLAAGALLLTLLAPVPAQAANGVRISPDGLMYPRAVRLEHSGSANGRIIADATGFPSGGPVGAIFQSTDDGASFSRIGTVADADARSGLCCTTIFELPQQIGSMPAGTLLWAGAVGQDGGSGRRMTIKVWRSGDAGRTWSYLSTPATSANSGGLWEPEFFVDGAGRLALHYADESQPGRSQVLSATSSTDGVGWAARRTIVAGSSGNHRPGMPVVRRLPDRSFLMIYEICGQAPSQYDCAVYDRTSPDGADWGDPAWFGNQVRLSDGRYFVAAPTIAVTSRGLLVAVGQYLRNADGSSAAGSGGTLFASDDAGKSWSPFAAPVNTGTPAPGPCDNYSSTLVPSADGTSVLEIATDDAGGCAAFAVRGPLPAGGVTTTTTARTTTTTTTTTSRTTTTTGGTASGCSAGLHVDNAWPGGYVGTVTLGGASALNGWSLAFTLPSGDAAVNVWNGRASGTSGRITVTDAGYNASVPANGTVSFGMQVNAAPGDPRQPSGWTLNGVACSAR